MNKAALDSEELTRVGPGTVMGNFMREYWIPAIKSSELVAGGDPMRLLLLGEKLVAARSPDGSVVVMDHRCPHRNASLFLGRNEDGGIRCTYHGWKFDASGACVDMPSVPAHLQFKDKVRNRAYRTSERNGLIWVYMGERKVPPPLPMVEISLLPEDQVDIVFTQRSCNWMQALEGDIDTSHFGFLHVGHLDPDEVPEGHALEHTANERAPEYHVRDTPWGTSYGAYRKVQKDGESKTYWRFSNFMLPFWSQTPQGQFPIHVHARAWVPMDDEHTMFVFLRWKRKAPTSRDPLKNGKPLAGTSMAEFQPNDTGWYGRWRLKANEGNDWMIDRDAMRTNRIFCGIDNIHLQDQAVTESMGGITDHLNEHLGPGDLMIARTRRRALAAARALRDNGTVPPGVDNPEVFLGSRSGFFLADPSVDWLAAFEDQVARCERPAEPAAMAK